MQRITNSDIKAALYQLNKALGRATEPYITGLPQPGCFREYSAYGSVGLHEMAQTGTGVISHGGLGTKRELYERIHAMIDGIRLVTPE